MGCDIHIYTEYLKDDYRNPGAMYWETSDPWGVVYPDQEKLGESVRPLHDGADRGEEYVIPRLGVPARFELWDGRNYWLFNALNGVRGNGPSYFEDRDVPEDACAWIRQDYKNWGSDAHSPCHATLAEFKSMREWIGENYTLPDQRDSLVVCVDEIIQGLEFRKRRFLRNSDPMSDERIRAIWWYDN